MKKSLFVLMFFMAVLALVVSSLVYAQNNSDGNNTNGDDTDDNITLSSENNSDGNVTIPDGNDNDNNESAGSDDNDHNESGTSNDGEGNEAEEEVENETENEVENETEKEDEVDNETETEVGDIDTEHGKEFRFSLLECALERRINWAGEVVDFLDGKGEDTAFLSEIIGRMDLIVDDVSGVDYTLPKKELIKEYVDYKKDSRTLVREFRGEARPLLNGEDNSELRARFKEADKEKWKECKEKIRKKRKLYYKEQVGKFLDKLGKADEELLRKIDREDVDLKEIKKKLRKKVTELEDDKKREFKEKIEKEVEREKAEVSEGVKYFKKGRIQRAKDKIEERTRRLGSTYSEVEMRLIKKLGVVIN